MLKIKLCAGLLAASLGFSAFAADSLRQGFFVVVPLEARAFGAAEGIDVKLGSATLPSALVGIPYAGYDFMNLLSVSGDAGYTGYGVKWSVLSGNLPAGLTLSADGKLTGTPTEAGTAAFELQATYKTKSGAQAFQVVVSRITVSVAPAAPPQAIVGQAYSFDLKNLLTVSGDPAYTGPGAVAWSVVSGSLPAGLSLRTDGTISGTPTAGGKGSLTVRAAYRGSRGDQTYEVVSLDINVGLGAGAPPQAIVGQAYTYDLKPRLTVSGDPAYTGSGVTWSVVENTLPSGLYLRNDGVVVGTPTVGGTGRVIARASYRGAAGQQSYQVVSLAISVGLQAGTPPQARVGLAYSYDLKQHLAVSGDPAYNVGGVSWAQVGNTLPAGLSLNSSGVISGTPTVATSGALTARATYRNVSAQQTYSITAIPDYTYAWRTSGWDVPEGCGSVRRTRDVWCQRSDGVEVASTYCTATRPSSSGTTSNYDACTFGWRTGPWTAYGGATCGNLTNVRDVWCERSDGAAAADSSCSGTRPADWQTNTNFKPC